MENSEFDQFADEYHATLAKGVSASGEGPEYFAEYKIKDIAEEIRQSNGGAVPTGLKLLDFGAGIGSSVPFVGKHFPDPALTCLDLSQRSLDIAEKRFPAQADYVCFDGRSIPYPDGHFDIAFAMCVFHHIDHRQHVQVLAELRRVLRKGGRLYIFEHNPLNPLTVRVVNNCPFDANAHLIRAPWMKKRLLEAGFGIARVKYRVFFPHALRRLRALEPALTWLPLGGQYFASTAK
jgi:ubiquinone/menaquinone biosynthesis C-methylase UbiE